MTKFKDALLPDIMGGCSLFHVETTDLLALTDAVKTVCGTLGYSLYKWGPSTGIQCLYATDRIQKDSNGLWMSEPNVENAFNAAPSNKMCSAVDLTTRMVTDPAQTHSDAPDTLISAKSVVIAEFLEDYFNNPVVRQTVIDGIAFNQFSKNKLRLIIAGPILNINPAILKYSTPLTLDLPQEEELATIALAVMKQAAEMSSEALKKAKKDKDEEAIKKYSNPWFADEANAEVLIPHLKGLTAFRAKRAIYQSTVRKFTTIDQVIQYISAYKMQVVENSKVLRFLPYNEQEDENHIGGFDNLLEFIRLRKNAFTEEARRQNLDTPKGVVLLGRPGTGKSLAAKAMGKMLGDLPVIVMDVGSLFGSLVGESEARVREALSIIDSINGCVLLIDEADKAFAGNNSGTSGDSGTSQRVLGSVLNWLNDHKSKTFVVLTLNRLDTLPPELLRAGRFDKTFYTDLPTPKERRQILMIHLNKRLGPLDIEVSFNEDEWLNILEATRDFVGAELEEVVKDARLRAFNQTGVATPSANDILECANARTAMAQSDVISKETMTACRKIATPVSGRVYKPEIDD